MSVQPQGPEVAVSNPKKILIVDDDVDFAESLRIALEGRQLEIAIANSGEDAIEHARHHSFDLCLMDVKLPGINGVECLNALRATRPGAKVVVMTGYSVQSLLDKANADGAWATLGKPLDIPWILGMIDRLDSACVLIADDDLDFAEELGRLIESQGCNTFLASDGIEARRRLDRNPMDVLILDIRMPRLRGDALFEALARDGKRPPTIIVTGYADAEPVTVARMKDLNLEGMLEKPIDPSELLTLVNELSAKRSA